MRLKVPALALFASCAFALSAPALAQKSGGTVVIAMTQAPPSLDPHVTSAQVARNVNLQMFETLYARDENAKAVPDLAEGVKISDDGRSYVFALRKGVKFHNGKEMTGADAAASLERYRKVGASAALLGQVDSVSATGAYEVTVKLKSVQSNFLDNLSSPRAPIAILPAEEAAKEGGKASPIGTGPFKFVEYKPDSHVTIEKFADYTQNTAYQGRDGFAGRKVVHVDKVTFRFMPEAGARNAALEAGEIHLNETADGPTAKRLKANAKLAIYPVLPFAFQVVKFNHAMAPGNDVNFRRAVHLALDMEEIMAIAYPDIYLLDHGWVWPNSSFNAGDTGKAMYNAKNAGAAKEALAKSSYKGEELTYIVDNTRPNVDVATVMQQQLAAIGIKLKLSVADWPTVSKIGFTPQGWQFWTHGFGIEPFEGPASVMQPWVGGNSQQAKDPVIDGLYEKFGAEMNEGNRKAIFAEFQKHMLENAVAVKTGSYGIFQIGSASLKNFQPYRIPRMWGVWLE